MRAISAVVALAVALLGCGGDDAESAASTTTQATTTTTQAPTTTTTTEADSGGIEPGADADADAIVNAYTVAFDSLSGYETKAAYIDDPNGLEETVGKYLTTGETMGGISVVVNDVMISGSVAEVTYDLLFNSNPTYPNQTGTAVLTEEGWKVPRQEFCGLMSSARVGCPAE